MFATQRTFLCTLALVLVAFTALSYGRPLPQVVEKHEKRIAYATEMVTVHTTVQASETSTVHAHPTGANHVTLTNKKTVVVYATTTVQAPGNAKVTSAKSELKTEDEVVEVDHSSTSTLSPASDAATPSPVPAPTTSTEIPAPESSSDAGSSVSLADTTTFSAPSTSAAAPSTTSTTEQTTPEQTTPSSTSIPEQTTEQATTSSTSTTEMTTPTTTSTAEQTTSSSTSTTEQAAPSSSAAAEEPKQEASDERVAHAAEEPEKQSDNQEMSADAFKGDGTFYTPGLGSCGGEHTESDLIAAINAPQYGQYANPNQAEVCGRCALVSGPKGQVKVTVVDRCPVCKQGDLDLSPAAYNKIGLEAEGRIPITWKFVEC